MVIHTLRSFYACGFVLVGSNNNNNNNNNNKAVDQGQAAVYRRAASYYDGTVKPQAKMNDQ